ncbi:hypothetical protein GCM10011611_21540 [Aliidongia dinghuensis]|uniref:Uncharacterized protein n=1 Tax=Aliidongia dinghuensis TaxID=1867774 RepID=A0A8J2YSU3_9PROT|nr:hypothetical protein [Aliidongia dinghuensis]GGF15453.1 hypothetical protein GCM10011611_21540 [Aliidongia dinghuensis]
MQTSLGRQKAQDAATLRASRRALGGFVLKLMLYAVFAVPAAVGSGHPLVRYVNNLGAICVFAAVLCGFLALLQRQRPGDRALNQWDEALGFAGIFFLLRGIALG